MKIYNFHPHSKIYLGFSEADESPLEPGDFLLPANSTLTEPPLESEGFVVCYVESNSTWQRKPDIRGVWFDAQQKIVQVVDHNQDVSALTKTPPPSPNHELVGGQWVLNQNLVGAAFTRDKKSRLDLYRADRDRFLNILNGMGFRSIVANDMVVRDAVAAFSQGLLDLPVHASIAGATDLTALEKALKDRYVALVTAVPSAVRAQFAQVVKP